MKTPLLACAWLICLTASSQTADDYINLGRERLATNNVLGAYHSFSSAVALDPAHQAGNVFLAATKMLAIPQRPIGAAFLDRLGIDAAGRDLFTWTAMIPADTNGLPYAPEGLNAEEFRLMLRTNLLGELQGAQQLLSRVTDPGFLLTLTSNETHAVSVTLDYGDVLILRALCKATEYSGYSLGALNVEANLSALRTLLTNDQLTVESLLRDHPQLFTFTTTNDFAWARQAFVEGVNLYMAGSQFILQRPPGLVRLFNLEEADLASELSFRHTLSDLTNSLYTATTLTADPAYQVHLAKQFDGTLALRSLLPKISGDSFILGTIPDLTFNGIFTGLQDWGVEEGLNTQMSSLPAFGPMGTFANGMLRYSLDLMRGRGYVIEQSANLLNWTPVFAFIAMTNHEPAEIPLGTEPGKFYRLADRTESMPPAINDDFANRIPIPSMNQPVRGYTAGATAEDFEWNYDLWDSFHSVWYSWTSPISERVSIILLGDTGSLNVNVFSGTSPTQLTQLWPEGYWQNDQSSGVILDVVAGTTYQIRVSSWWDDSGYELVLSRAPVLNLTSPADGLRVPVGTPVTISGTASAPHSSVERITIESWPDLDVQFSSSPFTYAWTNWTPGERWIYIAARDQWGASAYTERHVVFTPANDDFENATILTGSTVSITNVWTGASRQEAEPDHAGLPGNRSLWWQWTPTTTGPVSIVCRFTVSGWVESRAVAAYTARFSGPVASDRSLYAHVCASFIAEAGQTYYIASDVDDAWGGAEGTVHLQIIPTAAPTIQITSPTNGASFTYPATILLQASASDSDGTIQKVQFFDQNRFLGEATQPPYELLWTIPAREDGATINALAMDSSGAFSKARVPINIIIPAPPNDNFAQRILLTGNPAIATGHNIGATLETFEPAHYYSSGTKSVWWTWQAPLTGTATLSTEGSTFDTIVAVYTGSALGSLSLVADGDQDFDTGSYTAKIQFPVQAGVTYHIAVCGNYYGDSGEIALSVSQP